MQILIATDCFGAGAYIDALLHRILPKDADAIVIDPYQSIETAFDDDAEAEQAFTEAGGLSEYAEHVALAISEIQPDLAIGFGDGASALCQAALNPQAQAVQALLAIYPTQLELQSQPQTPVQLVLAGQQFNPAIETELVAFDEVDILLLEQPVGFMQPQSKSFDEAAYEAFLIQIRQWVAGE